MKKDNQKSSDKTLRDQSPDSPLSMLKSIPRFRKRWFNVFFTIIVIMIASAAMLLIYGLAFMLYRTGAIPALSFPHFSLILLVFAVSTVVIIALIAFLWGRIPLSPLNRLIDAMHRLSLGDYSVRLRDSRIHIFNELNHSFNKLATELGNTEMLSSDFVNNFSHEFKTPIMSIKGFAGLLRRPDISDAQKEEYASIIESESERLASMATNVLDLTRLENLTILSDVKRLNLSEQVRTCILLLENRIESKSIDLHAEFDEYYVNGSDELLRRVWINILDNAVKYSPDGATLDVSVSQSSDVCLVSIHNTGSFIPEESRDHIFSKFYQSDRSHASTGCGLGLAIAKRIVTLHRGAIKVESSVEDGTTFNIYLPVM